VAFAWWKTFAKRELDDEGASRPFQLRDGIELPSLILRMMRATGGEESPAPGAASAAPRSFADPLPATPGSSGEPASLSSRSTAPGETFVLPHEAAAVAAAGPALPGSGANVEKMILTSGASDRGSSESQNGFKTFALTIAPQGRGEAPDAPGALTVFAFRGSDGADSYSGNSGSDWFYGLEGGDRLTGGGGADLFAYTSASESTGTGYDTLTDFSFSDDAIDLPVAVTGLAKAVSKGGLSTATFDSDLAKAFSGLGAGQAGFFTPDSGDQKGQTFLVVDANGKAGYQSGEDYVFNVPTAPPADLGGTDFLI
jgi:hypothetical protein